MWARWRTLGEASIDGRTLVTRQSKSAPDRGDLMRLISAGDARLSLRRDRDRFGERWRNYEHSEPVVNILSQEARLELKAGEAFTFANLFYAVNLEEPKNYDIVKLSERAALVSGDETMIVGLGKEPWSMGPMIVEAEAFLMRADSLLMVEAVSLTLNEDPVFVCGGSRRLSGIALDLKGGSLTPKAHTSRQIHVAGRSIAVDPRTRKANAPELMGLDFSGVFEAASVQAEQRRKAEKEPLPRRASTSNLREEWKHEAGAAVSAMIASGSEVVLGLEDGRAELLDTRGEARWGFRAEGRINAVAVGDILGGGGDEILLASEDGNVYAVSRVGKRLWSYRCPPYARMSGKDGQARDVKVVDIDDDGRLEIAVGANNLSLRVLDSLGREEIVARSFADPRVALNGLAVIDIDGDRKGEVFSFPDSGSHGFSYRFDASGRLDLTRSDGWPSHILDHALVDLDGDRTDDIAYVTNRGNIYYRVRGFGGLSNERIFGCGVPAPAVAGKGFPGRSGHVAVGLGSCHVIVLNRRGDRVWQAEISAPVTDLEYASHPTGTLLALGARNGEVLFFDDEGNEVGVFVGESPVRLLVSFRRGVLAAWESGTVRLLSVISRNPR
jgi:hypothetical protein